MPPTLDPQNPLNNQTPETNPVESNQQPKESEAPHSVLKNLRTYQGDIEEAIGHKKESVASIVVAEQKKREVLPDTSPKKMPVQMPEISFFSELKNKSFLTFGIGLFILGVALVGGIYYLKSIEKPVVETRTTILSFTKEIPLQTTGKSADEIKSLIAIEKNKDTSLPNSVTYLSSTLSANDMFSILAKGMPPQLLRAVDGPYMIGLYALGETFPFIILATSDYGVSFSGMLEWEKNMPKDLGTIFEISPEDLVNPEFKDESIRNKDLRVLVGENRKTVLLYSFLDKNTILITKNEDAFNAILGKYQTSRLTQ
jgi:hypothetical protein